MARDHSVSLQPSRLLTAKQIDHLLTRHLPFSLRTIRRLRTNPASGFPKPISLPGRRPLHDEAEALNWVVGYRTTRMDLS